MTDPTTPQTTAIAVVEKKPAPAAGLLEPIADAKALIRKRKGFLDHLAATLVEGVDIVKVDGIKNPVFSKAAAESVNTSMGTVPRYEILAQEIDHDRVNEFPSKWVDTDEKPHKALADELKRQKRGRWKKRGDEYIWQIPGEGMERSYGLYRFVIRCILEYEGTRVGEGLGSCSTMESKYIDRPRECENTALKMAKKRAYVDATLSTFRLSDRYTQDVEDGGAGGGDFLDGELVAPQERPRPTQGGGSRPTVTTSGRDDIDEVTTSPAASGDPMAIAYNVMSKMDAAVTPEEVAVIEMQWRKTLGAGLNKRVNQATIRGMAAYARRARAQAGGPAYTPTDDEAGAIELLRSGRARSAMETEAAET